MEENLENGEEYQGFWHFLRYNPSSLLGYWLSHVRETGESFEFWQMLNWNAPSFLTFAPWDDVDEEA